MIVEVRHFALLKWIFYNSGGYTGAAHESTGFCRSRRLRWLIPAGKQALPEAEHMFASI
ncbi:MAG: hypothetical protein P4M15_14640 [Alphaproteobacteria bacterium]|nr:hypothetical protein [Alphaproteobacteria bacterium]